MSLKVGEKEEDFSVAITGERRRKLCGLAEELGFGWLSLSTLRNSELPKRLEKWSLFISIWVFRVAVWLAILGWLTCRFKYQYWKVSGVHSQMLANILKKDLLNGIQLDLIYAHKVFDVLLSSASLLFVAIFFSNNNVTWKPWMEIDQATLPMLEKVSVIAGKACDDLSWNFDPLPLLPFQVIWHYLENCSSRG
ncbi:unnamed protein product [Lactuca virosa]|uniref:Uncharacterized protein n=1 Tax=Lactuca virosa TaxID=75947 RepID=A0AAU9MYE7_9ASTR|nr:unnamed protein product [Lactuca virosa]